MIIYWDSVITIYLLDHTGSFQARARARLATLEKAGDRIAVSDLSRLERRIKPIRTGDAASLAQFDAFFARPDVQRVPLSTAVYDRDTLLRATYNSKLVDSLHLAAAIEAGCDLLLTIDHRLRKCTEIRIEVLP
ncbi:MAG: type II toxin-antitoxin system VapC family toxin [Planctomycetota bacterium]|nr:MAG: type II toxin-antitoxin system VapC family toxin [Planctomycetota bacterium]